MTDVLLLSVPVLDLQYPPPSPAIIKACIEQAGYSAEVFDTNILLYELCGSDEHFDNISNYFETSGTKTTWDNYVDALFDNEQELVKQWLSLVMDKIKQVSPNWLGISVFSYKSHKASMLIALTVRELYPNIKIVVGGRGASSWPFGPDYSAFKQKFNTIVGRTVKSADLGSSLLDANIIDSYIDGDGEQAIVSLLQNEEKRISGKIEEINLETVPYPNYDDYDLSKYQYVNERTLSITGSKGCVRRCTFCDIPVLWPKYKFRSGEHIAQEMLHLKQNYNVNKFYMSDSLVNGSLVAFKDFMSVLAEYNNKNPDDTIRWVGQYITRPVHQIPPGYYDLIKKSGGEGLTIGAESGSDNVRKHMRKKFSTYDLDTEIEEFDKRDIVCVLLFFSCYPTETWDDFLDTINMLINYQKYCASGTIYKITLGIPYTHHKDTPLWNMQDEIGLEQNTNTDILWLLKDNPELTFYERLRRRLILQELAFALNLPLSRNAAELNQLKYILQFHSDQLKEFFGAPEKISIWPDVFNLTSFSHLLMPLEIQQKIMSHRKAFSTLNNQIKEKHKEIEVDIRYDTNGYVNLREALA